MPVHNYSTIIVQQLAEAQRKLGIIPGAYIPADGAAGTVLTKASAADYDTFWGPPGAPAAGNGIVVVGNVVNFAQAGAYTAGAIPFATGVATMGFDAANLFWDDANNFFGIGTAGAPTNPLNVVHAYADALNQTMVMLVTTTSVSGGVKRCFIMDATSIGVNNFNAGLISGGAFQATHQGSGTVTGANRIVGLEVYHGKGTAGTGAIDSTVGLFVQALNQNALGAITDTYDIYIQSPIVTGTISNRYGVYQVSTASFNFFGGNTSIGTATFSTTIIARLERAYVTNTQAVYGTFCDVTNTPAAGTGQINCAGRFTFRTAGAQAFTLLDFSTIGCWGEVIHNGTNTVTTANGIRGFVNKATTGSITAAIAVRGIIDNNNGGGTITNAYVFFAQSPVVSGSFGAWYGVYVQGSGVSNGYGVYQIGTADFNFFGGNISISTATFDSNITCRMQKSYAVSGATTTYGYYADITETAGALSSGSHNGANIQLTLAGAQNYTYAYAATGIRDIAAHNGSGTATGVTGILLSHRKTSTGAVTSSYGIRIDAQNTNATAAIGTAYDIYIATATTTGAITTHYGIYIQAVGGTTAYGVAQLGTTDLNYFAGFTACGSASPVNTAWLLLGASTATITSLRIPIGSAAYGGTVEGDFWNDFTQKCLIGYIDGLKQYDVRDGFVQTDDKDVTNTNAETTMFGAGIGTLTFPANFFVVGKTVRVTLRGVLTQPVGGPTWTWRVKLGGVTLATSGAVTHAAETNRVWMLTFLLTCRTTGAGGTVIGQGGVFHYETGGPASVALAELPMAATAALNTTLARTLDVTLQLSAADAGQHNVTTNATVEVIA